MIIKTKFDSYIVTRTEYLFLFIAVLCLGQALPITQGGMESFQFSSDRISYSVILFKVFLLLYSILLLKKKNSGINIIPKVLLEIIIIWGVLQAFKYRMFSPYPIIRILNLWFAFAMYYIYGRRLFPIFEQIIYVLSWCALVGWILTITMSPLMLALAKASPFEARALAEGNSFIVYAIADSFGVLRRNLGFAWEPGRFGSILSIGLLINLFLNNFNLKNNKHFFIILGALLSSQSTTAYMAMIAVIVMYLYNKKVKYIILLLPIAIILIFYMLSLEFMGDKIKSLWFSDQRSYEWETELDYYRKQDGYLVPQRFEGMLYEVMNIMHDPILGNATSPDSYLYSLFQIHFSLSNGFLRIFANMGLFIGTLYYILLYKASKGLAFLFKYKGSIVFMLVFILINISYSWIFEPLFLAMLIIGYYNFNFNKVRTIKNNVI